MDLKWQDEVTHDGLWFCRWKADGDASDSYEVRHFLKGRARPGFEYSPITADMLGAVSPADDDIDEEGSFKEQIDDLREQLRLTKIKLSDLTTKHEARERDWQAKATAWAERERVLMADITLLQSTGPFIDQGPAIENLKRQIDTLQESLRLCRESEAKPVLEPGQKSHDIFYCNYYGKLREIKWIDQPIHAKAAWAAVEAARKGGAG